MALASQARSTLVLITLLCVNSVRCSSLSVALAPGTEECFFNELKRGEYMHLSVTVNDGVENQIEMSIWQGPDIELFRSGVTQMESAAMVASADDTYTLCIKNPKSSNEASLIGFSFVCGHDLHAQSLASLERLSAVEMYADTLSNSMDDLTTQYANIHERMEQHIGLAQATVSLISYGALTEIIVLIIVGVAQVWMVTSLFDQTAKV